jgi:DNA repair protein RadC
LTSSLREGASLLQLNFIDHIIVGNNSTDPTFSFRDAGLV